MGTYWYNFVQVNTNHLALGIGTGAEDDLLWCEFDRAFGMALFRGLSEMTAYLTGDELDNARVE